MLHTNATLLTEERARALVGSGLSLISFSIDGEDSETYESVDAGGKFERTLDGVRTFLRVKREARTRTPFTVVQMLTPSPQMANPDGRSVLLGLGADYLKIAGFHGWSGAFSRDGKETIPERGFEKLRRDPTEYAPCHNLWYGITVFWDGKVAPCCMDMEGEYPVGDVERPPAARTLEQRSHGRSAHGAGGAPPRRAGSLPRLRLSLGQGAGLGLAGRARHRQAGAAREGAGACPCARRAPLGEDGLEYVIAALRRAVGNDPASAWRVEAMPRAGEALEMARVYLDGPEPRAWVAKRLHPRLLRERAAYTGPLAGTGLAPRLEAQVESGDGTLWLVFEDAGRTLSPADWTRRRRRRPRCWRACTRFRGVRRLGSPGPARCTSFTGGDIWPVSGASRWNAPERVWWAA